MDSSKPRFCVIGAGRAGLVHASNLVQRIGSSALTTLCDADRVKLEQAGRELGVTDLLSDYREAVVREDIDAVIVATPTFLHCDIACLAAHHGKHVFLEKPMALSVEECRRINAAADRAGVKLQIGFMRRFDDRFRQAKEALATGDLGRVMLVKSTGRGPGGPGPWMYDLRKSNGVVAEVNSHDLDTLRWLSGEEYERVYAQGRNFKCPDAREAWPDFYDSFVAQFTFRGGAMGLLDGACPVHYGYDARVEVLCERGLLLVGAVEQPGWAIVTLDGQVNRRAVKSWRTLFKEAYWAELEHFIDCIREDRESPHNLRDAVKAPLACLAIRKSADAKGQKVLIHNDTCTLALA